MYVSVPSSFENALRKAFAEDCTNRYVSLSVSADDRDGSVRLYFNEGHRAVYQSQAVSKRDLNDDAKMAAMGDTCGRTLAKAVNSYDEKLFAGCEVVEETYEEKEHGWTENKVSKTRLVKMRKDGMSRGMSDKDQAIFKGIKGGTWESGLDSKVAERERAQREEREKKEQERRAALDMERWKAEEATRLAREAEAKRIADKEAFYEADDTFGAF